MSPARPRVLTINGGSSSIRFAVYELGETLERRLEGKVDRIGLSGTTLTCDDPARPPPNERALAGPKSATTALTDWLEDQKCLESVRAVGHRVVQGMQHTRLSR